MMRGHWTSVDDWRCHYREGLLSVHHVRLAFIDMCFALKHYCSALNIIKCSVHEALIHCNAMQCHIVLLTLIWLRYYPAAMYYWTLYIIHWDTLKYIEIYWIILKYIEIHCNILKYIEIHWNTLQYIAILWNTLKYIDESILSLQTPRFVVGRSSSLRALYWKRRKLDCNKPQAN